MWLAIECILEIQNQVRHGLVGAREIYNVIKGCDKSKHRVLQEHTGGESGKAPGSLLRREELHSDRVSEDVYRE